MRRERKGQSGKLGSSQPARTQADTGKGVEIERKFKVKCLPANLARYPKEEILQGYVAVQEGDVEVRLRKKANKHFQTVKIGSGLSRLELEIELTQEQFEALWPATEGRRLQKARYGVDVHGRLAELDVYHGSLRGLVLAEVEFSSLRDSEEFLPPPWFGVEVTEDDHYKNKALATYGLPES